MINITPMRMIIRMIKRKVKMRVRTVEDES